MPSHLCRPQTAPSYTQPISSAATANSQHGQQLATTEPLTRSCLGEELSSWWAAWVPEEQPGNAAARAPCATAGLSVAAARTAGTSELRRALTAPLPHSMHVRPAGQGPARRTERGLGACTRQLASTKHSLPQCSSCLVELAEGQCVRARLASERGLVGWRNSCTLESGTKSRASAGRDGRGGRLSSWAPSGRPHGRGGRGEGGGDEEALAGRGKRAADQRKHTIHAVGTREYNLKSLK